MIVLSLIGIMTDVELERSPMIWTGAIDLVVDSLLSTLVDKKIVPETEGNHIAEAHVGIGSSVGVCDLLRRIQTRGIAAIA